MIFDKSYFSASGNHYWNQGEIIFKERPYPCYEQLIFLPVVTIFFFIFQRVLSVIPFFHSSGKAFFNEIVHFSHWKHISKLIMVSTSRKKVVNKVILFALDPDSTSQNEV